MGAGRSGGESCALSSTVHSTRDPSEKMNHSSPPSVTHSRTQLLTLARTHVRTSQPAATRSRTHSRTPSPTNSRAHTLAHSLTRALVPFRPATTHALTHSSPYAHTPVVPHSRIHSLTASLTLFVILDSISCRARAGGLSGMSMCALACCSLVLLPPLLHRARAGPSGVHTSISFSFSAYYPYESTAGPEPDPAKIHTRILILCFVL